MNISHGRFLKSAGTTEGREGELVVAIWEENIEEFRQFESLKIRIMDEVVDKRSTMGRIVDRRLDFGIVSVTYIDEVENWVSVVRVVVFLVIMRIYWYIESRQESLDLDRAIIDCGLPIIANYVLRVSY
jgi:hypothetical protein